MNPSSSTTSQGTHPTGWLARVFPHPVLSLQLGATWLVLAHSWALVHWLSALALAWLVPVMLRPFLTDASQLHWPSVVRLTGVVLWDIVMSNITVARITLGSLGQIEPAWVPVPLESDHPRVNALLASIITMTPGTVSAVVQPHRREILVHALNCDDTAALARDIKERYEAPLLRVFSQDRVFAQPGAAS